MQDRPSRTELLTTVEEFLRDDVLGELPGAGLAYQLRVALNLIGILKRDIQLSDGHEAVERKLIGNLLGRDQDEPLDVLNEHLSQAIQEGLMDAKVSELIAALKTITANKLDVTRPGYDKS